MGRERETMKGEDGEREVYSRSFLFRESVEEDAGMKRERKWAKATRERDGLVQTGFQTCSI